MRALILYFYGDMSLRAGNILVYTRHARAHTCPMETGTLYVIASPIGNMEDITLRALRILREEVSAVYCEDTRQTRKILTHYGISLPARALHTHSSVRAIDQALEYLLSGSSAAYLTDSGTPGISDPGSLLVSRAREESIPVVPIPGPSALTALVSVAGFMNKNIIFAGFISRKKGKRLKELRALATQRGTIVLYESPYRVRALLEALIEVFPGKEMIIGREMTKFHEEYIPLEPDNVESIANTIIEKGEFAIAVSNDEAMAGPEEEDEE